MACKPNEIAILKSAVVKLDEDHLMFLGLMFHTADKEAKRNGTDSSFYRYEGTVFKTADFKQMLESWRSDAHAMEDWTWPTKDPWWKPTYYISYFGDHNKKTGAKWFGNRFKKILDWDAFLELATKGTKMTAKGPKTSDSAKYELSGYTTEDGQKLDIKSPTEMKAFLGKCFGKPLPLKRDMKA